MTTRTCKDCEVTLPLEAFPVVNRKAGREYRSHQCRPCRSAAQALYQQDYEDRKRHQQRVALGRLINWPAPRMAR